MRPFEWSQLLGYHNLGIDAKTVDQQLILNCRMEIFKLKLILAYQSNFVVIDEKRDLIRGETYCGVRKFVLVESRFTAGCPTEEAWSNFEPLYILVIFFNW
jgi:hypothetical protein